MSLSSQLAIHGTVRRRKKNARQRPGSSSARTAFTLVEMLVATALVVLIMMMFAQIYGSTIQTITLQRGIGNNDQKARALNTVILSDLRAMTYRQAQLPFGAAKGIVPLASGQAAGHIDTDRQKGYFYYSENDPNNDTDDVLQFTAMIATAATAGDTSADSTRVFLGKARNLTPSPTPFSSNQPDMDDKLQDDQSQSRAAEICYFLRGGNLYRRVLLLRDSQAGATSTASQPQKADGTQFYDAMNMNYNLPPRFDTSQPASFYVDFDYSATRMYTNVNPSQSYLWFNSIASLSPNDGQAIAQPWNRFGHFNDPFSTDASPSRIPNYSDYGCPKEFGDASSPGSSFIGRYTSEETSNTGMGWPGLPANSLSRSISTPVDGSTFVATTFAGGTRIAEDLLMTNVEAFNVEYYDDNFGEYKSLNTQVNASLAANSWNKNQNPFYGPLPYTAGSGRINNVFDTWHPNAFAVQVAGTSKVSAPPLSPMVSTGTLYADWNSLPSSINLGDMVSVVPNTSNPSFVYRAIRAGNKGTVDLNFTLSIDRVVQEVDGGPDTGAVWQCIDNRVGLKSIQINIRFRDPNKGLAKQMTLVHSFVE